MSEVAKHFDAVAPTYDTWKKRNHYYYENLKVFFQGFVPRGGLVFDFGCGTGEILASLEPHEGIGMDISPEMVKIARVKFSSQKNLYFTDSQEDPRISSTSFEYIICADVIEHLEDIDSALQFLRRVSGRNTRVIISMATALWEPILMVLEKLHMKMPEGPHNRISFRTLRRKLELAGFLVEESGTRLLVPTDKIPFADAVNARFYKFPLLRKLGLVGYIVARPLFR